MKSAHVTKTVKIREIGVFRIGVGDSKGLLTSSLLPLEDLVIVRGAPVGGGRKRGSFLLPSGRFTFHFFG
jgi:hypothetical protein